MTLKQTHGAWQPSEFNARVTPSAKRYQVTELIGSFVVSVKSAIGFDVVNAQPPFLLRVLAAYLAFMPIAFHCRSFLTSPIAPSIRNRPAAIIGVTRAHFKFRCSCTSAFDRTITAAPPIDRGGFSNAVRLTAYFALQMHEITAAYRIAFSAFARTMMGRAVRPFLKRFTAGVANTYLSFGRIRWSVGHMRVCAFRRAIFRPFLFTATELSTAAEAFGCDPMRFNRAFEGTIGFVGVLAIDKRLTARWAGFHGILTDAISHVVRGQSGVSATFSGATLGRTVHYTIHKQELKVKL